MAGKSFPIRCNRMEVTFDINDEIVERLRLESGRCGKTMSALVESALQMSLPANPSGLLKVELPAPTEPAREPLPPLPTWRAEFLVDINSKEELYRVLDEDEDSHLRRLYGYRPDRAPEEKE